jgi:hypothetical protein
MNTSTIHPSVGVVTGSGALALAMGAIAVSTFKSGREYVQAQYVPGTGKLTHDDKAKASDQAFAQTGLAGLVGIMGGISAIATTNEGGKVGKVGATIGIGCALLGVATISNSIGISTSIR